MLTCFHPWCIITKLESWALCVCVCWYQPGSWIQVFYMETDCCSLSTYYYLYGFQDTAGAEQFQAMSAQYYRGAGAAIVCYGKAVFRITRISHTGFLNCYRLCGLTVFPWLTPLGSYFFNTTLWGDFFSPRFQGELFFQCHLFTFDRTKFISNQCKTKLVRLKNEYTMGSPGSYSREGVIFFYVGAERGELIESGSYVRKYGTCTCFLLFC